MPLNLELLQSISLAVSQARQTSSVLQMVVTGLVDQAGFALARIWLLPATASPEKYLHLAASAGRSVVDATEWNQLTGRFARVALGPLNIGRIAQEGESMLLDEQAMAQSHAMADPHWMEREQIKAFAGHPLIFKGEVLGVLAIFSREPVSTRLFKWLRLFADHAAVSISNARAFEEINRLRERLEQENEYLRGEVQENFGGLVGESIALQTVLQQIGLVAPTDSNVLITGESGTGKELVARAIHERSRRSGRALVKVNCASVPQELFESEFFGHVKGAFTGALRDRAGRFQLADEGTLFLDEIGEIPLALQGKLLRVLQEGEFERLGADRTQRVNVRVIAATNRPLKEEVAQGKFRPDLYFRLNVFPLEVPSLRERPEDIPLLAAYFLRQSASRMGIPLPTLSETNVRELLQHSWPGNIRELQNAVERAVILARGGPMRFQLQELLADPEGRRGEPAPAATQKAWLKSQQSGIQEALRRSGGKIYGPGGAAELLGLRPTTLASRMAALGIRRR